MAQDVVFDGKGIAQESVYQLSPFQRALGRMVSIPTVLPQGTKVETLERDLVADSFWTYYGQPVQKDPLPPSRDLNARLIEWAKKSPAWEASQSKTNGRLLVSAASAGILAGQLIGDPEIKKLLDEQKEKEEAEKEAQAAQNALEGMEQAGVEDPGGKDALQKKLQQAQQKAQAAQQKIEQGLQKLDGQRGQAMRAKMVRDAQQGAEQTEQFLSSWGVDAGQVGATDLQAVQKAVQQFGGALEEITRLMGRVKGLALSQKARKQNKSNMVVEDGYTQKLPQIFPSELSLLRPGVPGVIRAAKMGEYADRGLIGMVEGSETKQEGGVIFLVDGSGSMEGERHIKATALALGMAQAAAATGQPYAIARFSSFWDDLITVDSSADWGEHLQWASKMQGGGTDFSKPLTWAMDQIEALGERSENTDVVMITDGECNISGEVVARWNEMKGQLGTRMLYLAVGYEGGDALEEMTQTKLELGDGVAVEEAATRLGAFLWDEEGKR